MHLKSLHVVKLYTVQHKGWCLQNSPECAKEIKHILLYGISERKQSERLLFSVLCIILRLIIHALKS